MKATMDKEQIIVVTQSILAILVAIGSGLIIFLKPENADIVLGVLGMVIGWYFHGASTAQAVNQITRAQSINK